MSTPDTATITNAFIALVSTVTARPVGDGKLPTQADPPFAVVYQIPGGASWGPDYTEPNGAAALVYQVTSVAVSRDDVESFADAVRHAVLDRDGDGVFVTPMPVAGLSVLDRELVSYGGVDSDRGVFNVRDTFQIHVTRQ